MKFCSFSLVLGLLALARPVCAQSDNLYTKPHTDAPGGLSGHVSQELTHAIALEHDRVSCYRAELSDGNKGFRFPGLPTGKYDLFFVTKSGAVYEGAALGEDASKLSPGSLKNFETRVNKADGFFNKAKVDRIGLIEDGSRLLAFVERLRDLATVRQSGEALNSNLRRLEVIEFDKAADDWQMMKNRHLYREEQPQGPNMAFLKHKYLPEISGVRVVDSVKDLGTIALPPAS